MPRAVVRCAFSHPSIFRSFPVSLNSRQGERAVLVMDGTILLSLLSWLQLHFFWYHIDIKPSFQCIRSLLFSNCMVECEPYTGVVLPTGRYVSPNTTQDKLDSFQIKVSNLLESSTQLEPSNASTAARHNAFTNATVLWLSSFTGKT